MKNNLYFNLPENVRAISSERVIIKELYKNGA